MCLTVPHKIKKINGQSAKLADGRQVNIALIKNAKIGDWILANADLAVSKITAKEAKKIKSLLSNH